MLKKFVLSLLVLMALTLVIGYFAANHYRQALYDLALELGSKQSQLSAKQIRINDHDIHYLENSLRGEQPTMVLIHGFGAFKENWLSIAPQLSSQFHLMLIDLPGHGNSSFVSTQSYDIDQQAAMLHRFLEKTVKQPVILVGNSMGGSTAAFFAATYPQQTQAAVLIDPGHITEVGSPFTEMLAQGKNPLVVRSPEDFKRLLPLVMAKPPFSPWFMQRVSAEKMAARADKNDKIWQDITLNHTYDFKQVVTQINAPVLILWGKQDQLLDYKNAYIFKELIPQAKLQILDGIGHAAMIEAPKQTANVIKSFLANLRAPDQVR